MSTQLKFYAQKWFPLTWNATWALTLLTLPVTSFPLLSKLTGGTLVAPLPILPLIWLGITWLPYHYIKKKTLPGEIKPLFIFILFVLISCGLAFYIKTPFYKSHSIQKSEFEALLSLGVGLTFLLVTISRLQSLTDIKKSLVWINIGGIIFLTMSLIQIIVIIFLKGDFPPIVIYFQKIFSVSNFNDHISGVRIPGLTLEPSWLAHSLNMIYIPAWLAASRYKISVFRYRLGPITVENLLLAAGIMTMIMTYSRIGLIGFLAILIWFMVDAAGAISMRLSAHRKNKNINSSGKQKAFVTASLIVTLLAGFLILIYTLSFQDNRFKKFFNLISSDSNYQTNTMSLISLAKKINFGERVVYWDFGWKVFNKYPIFGVGLGNVGRFSEQLLSPEAWKMGEVRSLLLYESTLPNTKNLWVRILSETGLVGFSVYATWLIVLWFAGRKLYMSANPGLKAIGLAGQFVIIAHLFEGFSLDTFALPYVWISFGILIAGIALSRKKSKYENQNTKQRIDYPTGFS